MLEQNAKKSSESAILFSKSVMSNLAVLYIGMYYNVTLGLKLTNIAAVSVILFIYTAFLNTYFYKLTLTSKTFKEKKLKTVFSIFLFSVSLILLFNAEKFFKTNYLAYYYFAIMLIYETMLFLTDYYCADLFITNGNNMACKKFRIMGLLFSAAAFPLIHCFASFTATAAFYASFGFFLSLFSVIRYKEPSDKYIKPVYETVFDINSIKYFFSYKKYVKSLIIFLLLETAWIITISSYPVYTKFSLNIMFISVALFQVCSLLPVYIIKCFLEPFFYKRRHFLYALLLCVAGSFAYFFSNGILLTCAAAFIFGSGYAMASSINENNLNYEIKRYAFFNNGKSRLLYGFKNKFASLSSVLKSISLCSLTLFFNYSSGLSHGARASLAWRFAYGVLPLIFISAVLSIFISDICRNKLSLNDML